jgi:NADPH-dependent ferric siderophore reductase
VRREPPPFRTVEVARTTERTPRLVRVTLAGAELAGFELDLPAASVRLLLPQKGSGQLVLPTWDGNEFRAPDGGRPPIRTLTPLRFDPEALELDVEVVRHGDSPLSRWVGGAASGDPVALSGPGRGYEIDPDAPSFLLGGDESALPAIGMLIPLLPPDAQVEVVVEVADPSARLDLPGHPQLVVRWVDLDAGARPGDALVAAVTGTEIDALARVWVAGEAAAVQRIRRHLFEEVCLGRARCTVRGYWKVARGGAT